MARTAVRHRADNPLDPAPPIRLIGQPGVPTPVWFCTCCDGNDCECQATNVTSRSCLCCTRFSCECGGQRLDR